MEFDKIWRHKALTYKKSGVGPKCCLIFFTIYLSISEYLFNITDVYLYRNDDQQHPCIFTEFKKWVDLPVTNYTWPITTPRPYDVNQALYEFRFSNEAVQ